MNHWCESCARKNMCYVVDDRPKCFVPITNTASGTSESYLAKSLRDSHEIAKDEPQTAKVIGCSKCSARFWCMDRDMPHAVHCNNYGKSKDEQSGKER